MLSTHRQDFRVGDVVEDRHTGERGIVQKILSGGTIGASATIVVWLVKHKTTRNYSMSALNIVAHASASLRERALDPIKRFTSKHAHNYAGVPITNIEPPGTTVETHLGAGPGQPVEPDISGVPGTPAAPGTSVADNLKATAGSPADTSISELRQPAGKPRKAPTPDARSSAREVANKHKLAKQRALAERRRVRAKKQSTRSEKIRTHVKRTLGRPVNRTASTAAYMTEDEFDDVARTAANRLFYRGPKRSIPVDSRLTPEIVRRLKTTMQEEMENELASMEDIVGVRYPDVIGERYAYRAINKVSSDLQKAQKFFRNLSPGHFLVRENDEEITVLQKQLSLLRDANVSIRAYRNNNLSISSAQFESALTSLYESVRDAPDVIRVRLSSILGEDYTASLFEEAARRDYAFSRTAGSVGNLGAMYRENLMAVLGEDASRAIKSHMALFKREARSLVERNSPTLRLGEQEYYDPLSRAGAADVQSIAETSAGELPPEDYSAIKIEQMRIPEPNKLDLDARQQNIIMAEVEHFRQQGTEVNFRGIAATVDDVGMQVAQKTGNEFDRALITAKSMPIFLEIPTNEDASASRLLLGIQRAAAVHAIAKRAAEKAEPPTLPAAAIIGRPRSLTEYETGLVEAIQGAAEKLLSRSRLDVEDRADALQNVALTAIEYARQVAPTSSSAVQAALRDFEETRLTSVIKAVERSAIFDPRERIIATGIEDRILEKAGEATSAEVASTATNELVRDFDTGLENKLRGIIASNATPGGNILINDAADILSSFIPEAVKIGDKPTDAVVREVFPMLFSEEKEEDMYRLAQLVRKQAISNRLKMLSEKGTRSLLDAYPKLNEELIYSVRNGNLERLLNRAVNTAITPSARLEEGVLGAGVLADVRTDIEEGLTKLFKEQGLDVSSSKVLNIVKRAINVKAQEITDAVVEYDPTSMLISTLEGTRGSKEKTALAETALTYLRKSGAAEDEAVRSTRAFLFDRTRIAREIENIEKIPVKQRTKAQTQMLSGLRKYLKELTTFIGKSPQMTAENAPVFVQSFLANSFYKAMYGEKAAFSKEHKKAISIGIQEALAKEAHAENVGAYSRQLHRRAVNRILETTGLPSTEQETAFVSRREIIDAIAQVGREKASSFGNAQLEERALQVGGTYYLPVTQSMANQLIEASENVKLVADPTGKKQQVTLVKETLGGNPVIMAEDPLGVKHVVGEDVQVGLRLSQMQDLRSIQDRLPEARATGTLPVLVVKNPGDPASQTILMRPLDRTKKQPAKPLAAAKREWSSYGERFEAGRFVVALDIEAYSDIPGEQTFNRLGNVAISMRSNITLLDVATDEWILRRPSKGQRKLDNNPLAYTIHRTGAKERRTLAAKLREIHAEHKRVEKELAEIRRSRGKTAEPVLPLIDRDADYSISMYNDLLLDMQNIMETAGTEDEKRIFRSYLDVARARQRTVDYAYTNLSVLQESFGPGIAADTDSIASLIKRIDALATPTGKKKLTYHRLKSLMELKALIEQAEANADMRQKLLESTELYPVEASASPEVRRLLKEYRKLARRRRQSRQEMQDDLLRRRGINDQNMSRFLLDTREDIAELRKQAHAFAESVTDRSRRYRWEETARNLDALAEQSNTEYLRTLTEEVSRVKEQLRVATESSATALRSTEERMVESAHRVLSRVEGLARSANTGFTIVVANENFDLGWLKSFSEQRAAEYEKSGAKKAARTWRSRARAFERWSLKNEVDVLAAGRVVNPGTGVPSLQKLAIEQGVVALKDQRVHGARGDTELTLDVFERIRDSAAKAFQPKANDSFSKVTILSDYLENDVGKYIVFTRGLGRGTSVVGTDATEISNRVLELRGVVQAAKGYGLHLYDIANKQDLIVTPDNPQFLSALLEQAERIPEEEVEQRQQQIAADLANRRIHRLLAGERVGQNFEYQTFDVRYRAATASVGDKKAPENYILAEIERLNNEISAGVNVGANTRARDVAASQLSWAREYGSDVRMQQQFAAMQGFYEKDWAIHRRFFEEVDALPISATAKEDLIKIRYTNLFGQGGVLQKRAEKAIPALQHIPYLTPRIRGVNNPFSIVTRTQETTEFGLTNYVADAIRKLLDEEPPAHGGYGVNARRFITDIVLGKEENPNSLFDRRGYLLKDKRASVLRELTAGILRSDHTIRSGNRRINVANELMRNILTSEERKQPKVAAASLLEQVRAAQDPLAEMARLFRERAENVPAIRQRLSTNLTEGLWFVSPLLSEESDSRLRARIEESDRNLLANLKAAVEQGETDLSKVPVPTVAGERPLTWYTPAQLAQQRAAEEAARKAEWARLKFEPGQLTRGYMMSMAYESPHYPVVSLAGKTPKEVVDKYGIRGLYALQRLYAHASNPAISSNININERQYLSMQRVLGWTPDKKVEDWRLAVRRTPRGKTTPVYEITTLRKLREAGLSTRDVVSRLGGVRNLHPEIYAQLFAPKQVNTPNIEPVVDIKLQTGPPPTHVTVPPPPATTAAEPVAAATAASAAQEVHAIPRSDTTVLDAMVDAAGGGGGGAGGGVPRGPGGTVGGGGAGGGMPRGPGGAGGGGGGGRGPAVGRSALGMADATLNDAVGGGRPPIPPTYDDFMGRLRNFIHGPGGVFVGIGAISMIALASSAGIKKRNPYNIEYEDEVEMEERGEITNSQTDNDPQHYRITGKIKAKTKNDVDQGLITNAIHDAINIMTGNSEKTHTVSDEREPVTRHGALNLLGKLIHG